MTDHSRQAFLTSAENKNIHSAYLIVCSRPNVSAKLANDFLMRLYCKNGACGQCSNCIKVQEGHIDIMRLSAPKVDEFREAIVFLSQKPVESQYKVIVIEDADNMTDSAANSMLKTLEQPPEGSVILLLARSVSGVLPTITSRCAAVYLSRDPDAIQSIQTALGVDETKACILADMSGGFVDEASRINKDAFYWQLREDTLNLLHKLMHQKGMAISAYVEFFEKHKEHIDMLFPLIQSYCRDISVYQKTKNIALVVNRDRTREICDTASHFTTRPISNMIRIILDAERRFLVPVNFSLATEKMLFDILEELNK